MNKLFEEKLTQLAEDDNMIQAIQIIFEEQIDNEKPKVKQGEGDEILGQKYRAYEKAKVILAEAITAIKGHKASKDNNKEFDKHR